MSVINSLIAHDIVEMVIESIAWGSFGYLFFRIIGVKEKYWYWDCLVVFLVLLLWTYMSNLLMIKLDLSTGNKEVLAFLDNDYNSLFETNYLHILFCALEVFCGYVFGKYLLNRLKRM